MKRREKSGVTTGKSKKKTPQRAEDAILTTSDSVFVCVITCNPLTYIPALHPPPPPRNPHNPFTRGIIFPLIDDAADHHQRSRPSVTSVTSDDYRSVISTRAQLCSNRRSLDRIKDALFCRANGQLPTAKQLNPAIVVRTLCRGELSG